MSRLASRIERRAHRMVSSIRLTTSGCPAQRPAMKFKIDLPVLREVFGGRGRQREGVGADGNAGCTVPEDLAAPPGTPSIFPAKSHRILRNGDGRVRLDRLLVRKCQHPLTRNGRLDQKPRAPRQDRRIEVRPSPLPLRCRCRGSLSAMSPCRPVYFYLLRIRLIAVPVFQPLATTSSRPDFHIHPVRLAADAGLIFLANRGAVEHLPCISFTPCTHRLRTSGNMH